MRDYDFLLRKRAKERAVAGGAGTNMWEISAMVCLFPLSLWTLRVLLRIGPKRGHRRGIWRRIILEFAVLVVPVVSAFTHWARIAIVGTILVAVGASVIAAGLALRRRATGAAWDAAGRIHPTLIHGAPPHAPDTQLAHAARPRLHFVSCYRAAVLLSTSVAILAVDFPALFPRRFSKTEEFGAGLMDIGVGSFVLSAAIVAAAPRADCRPTLQTATRRVAPLLTLGFARLATVKSLEYQEHVSEYGVHWNFFFTAAAVGFFSAVLPVVLPPLGALFRAAPVGCPCAVGTFLMLVHEAALSGGVAEYILRAPRMGGTTLHALLSQNREGVCSMPGFLALHFLGAGLGQWLRRELGGFSAPSTHGGTGCEWKPRKRTTGAQTGGRHLHGRHRGGVRRWRSLATLLVLNMFLWTIVVVPRLRSNGDGPSGAYAETLGACGRCYDGRVSRRMCNAPYIVWILALGTLVLAAALAIDLAAGIFFGGPGQEGTPVAGGRTPLRGAQTMGERMLFSGEGEICGDAISVLIRALNSNMLPIFLLANAFTGFANVSLSTLELSAGLAFSTILLYMWALIAVACMCFLHGLRLKL